MTGYVKGSEDEFVLDCVPNKAMEKWHGYYGMLFINVVNDCRVVRVEEDDSSCPFGREGWKEIE